MKENQYFAFGYLISMAVVLPWSNAFMNILIFGGILFIIQNAIIDKRIFSRLKKASLLFYLCLAFIGMILLNGVLLNDPKGFHYVLRMLTVLILPVMMKIMIGKTTDNQIRKIINLYIHSVSILCLASLLIAISGMVLKANTVLTLKDIAYTNLSSVLVNHEPIYFSLFVGLAILLATSEFLSKKNSRKSLIYVVGVVFLLLFLFLLGSRTTILATFVSLGVLGIVRSRKFLVGLLLLFTIIFAVNYNYNSSFRLRIDYVINFNTEFNFQENWSYEGLAVRFMTWNCSLEGISNHFWLGTGVSGAQDYLDNCFREHKYESLLFFTRENGAVFNSHNLYLDVFLKLGVFGFVLLMTILILILYKSSRYKNIHLLLILTFFMVNGLTESVLVREKGIMLFTFFFGLFLCYNPKQPKITITK
ncbi:O-antigen ligase family protein [Maribacter polysaccharolyticus]|uniref:O-antigen ligase family protein n=1 Tax=Maribacter polysaccharolyticus TaxID=3020831 RepID=UPI00237FA255|nr:O-antigen ligase family protein [Maribacter polysaccharolyticus]MDE3742225.1 O-antigen ligase family protein [Maribacter polysaccharolyticus]